jgi:hypothetical protein
MQDVWVPDTYFQNEKSATFHTVTVPNKLLHIKNNGLVTYSVRWEYLINFIFKHRSGFEKSLAHKCFVDHVAKP